jgi:polyhydroxyalkanoate synthesis regulator phasin
MKLLVDVTDSKGDFILELLNNFSFAKAKPISPAKAQLLEEIKEAVENLNLVKQGKLKARTAKELLDEL